MGLLSRLKRAEPELVTCLALAFALAAVQWALQSHIGLAVQDEGFLWYGVDAVRRGEVPVRDFRSYDPGRYAWCAAFSFVFGDGIVALRASCALFQAVGLACGLLALTRVTRPRATDGLTDGSAAATWAGRAWLAAAAVVITLWMFPPWKLFESSLSAIAVYVGVLVLERPSARRHALAGAFTGAAAFFGRNHGLYCTLGFALLVGHVWWHGASSTFDRAPEPRSLATLARHLAAFAGGVVIGYTPMIAPMVFVPGFASAWHDSVRFYLHQSQWNAPFAIAWPWAVENESSSALALASAYALSAFFVLYVVGYGALALCALRGRRVRPADVDGQNLAVAALCIGLPYLHHVAIRSDVHHVGQSIHPLLIGAFALVSMQRAAVTRALAFGLLFAATVLAIGPQQPFGKRLLARGTAREFVPFDARGDELLVDGTVARRLDAVRARIVATVPAGAKLFMTAKLLAMYPLLDRRAPVWDVYPQWKADAEHEQRMLNELSDVDWAFIEDQPLAGSEDARFSVAYPAVWRRLEKDFARIPTPELPPAYVFSKRR